MVSDKSVDCLPRGNKRPPKCVSLYSFGSQSSQTRVHRRPLKDTFGPHSHLHECRRRRVQNKVHQSCTIDIIK